MMKGGRKGIGEEVVYRKKCSYKIIREEIRWNERDGWSGIRDVTCITVWLKKEEFLRDWEKETEEEMMKGRVGEGKIKCYYVGTAVTASKDKTEYSCASERESDSLFITSSFLLNLLFFWPNEFLRSQASSAFIPSPPGPFGENTSLHTSLWKWNAKLYYFKCVFWLPDRAEINKIKTNAKRFRSRGGRVNEMMIPSKRGARKVEDRRKEKEERKLNKK
jgi:hypothetical protein